MVLLTESQQELLVLIVESGSARVLLVQTHDGDSLVAGHDRGEVDATDFRELVAQNLLRPAGGQTYELTNAGRVAYQQLTAPEAAPTPDPPPPPRRRPPSSDIEDFLL